MISAPPHHTPFRASYGRCPYGRLASAMAGAIRLVFFLYGCTARWRFYCWGNGAGKASKKAVCVFDGARLRRFIGGENGAQKRFFVKRTCESNSEKLQYLPKELNGIRKGRLYGVHLSDHM